MIQAPATLAKASGLWSVPGVPHKGWTCHDVEDHEEPSFLCEMCCIRMIRFAHVMRHDEYPEDVRAGCICAGHMGEDYAAAKDRERVARNKAGRRVKLVERYKYARMAWSLEFLNWSTGKKGNYYRAVRGKQLTVYWQRHESDTVAWKWVYGDQFDRQCHPSSEAAMKASFDRLFPLHKLLEWADRNPGVSIKFPGDKGF